MNLAGVDIGFSERRRSNGIAVWRDGVHILEGKRLFYFQAVHQESDVVPENIDAIRALLEIQKDARKSMEKTDQTLGIGMVK